MSDKLGKLAPLFAGSKPSERAGGEAAFFAARPTERAEQKTASFEFPDPTAAQATLLRAAVDGLARALTRGNHEYLVRERMQLVATQYIGQINELQSDDF